MPLEVIVSSQARDDIKSIVSYIAANHPEAAVRWRRRLEGRFAQLTEFPALGRDRSEFGLNLRSVPVGNHLIFYRATAGKLEIVRLLHGAQDIASELNERR